MKTCRDCLATLPLDGFYANARRADGRASYCKPCHIKRNQAAERRWREKNPEAAKERDRQQGRRWREKHPGRPRDPELARARRLMREYGLTTEAYNELLASQSGGCAVCGRTDSGTSQGAHLRVDHCHETGQVRGLLCDPCNRNIGLIGDTVEAFERVLAYLRKTA
jgi:hypothetical protein